MSWPALLTWLLLLPASTWLLGCLLALRDLPEPAPALGRLARAGTPFLAAALLLGRDAATPALLAFGTAFGLHLGWSVLTRTAVDRGWMFDDDA